jgi:hypothetical protein
MTSIILNRIFQVNNDILVQPRVDELIMKLTPYMLYNKNKGSIRIVNTDIEPPNNNSKTNKIEQESTIVDSPTDMISPMQRDSLFWCIYIVIHDYNEYNVIRNNHNTREIEWKQELSKRITTSPAKIKNSNHKTTKANVAEILSDLMTTPYKTDVLCLIAITVYYNINFVIMNEKKTLRFEFTTNATDDANTYLLYKNDRNYYSIRIDPLLEFELADIRNTSYLIENNEKQLKSIGSYKVDRLEQYVKQFGMYNEAEKYKKLDLYILLSGYVTKFTI